MEEKEHVENAQNGAKKLNRHNTVPLLGINDDGDGKHSILMEGYPLRMLKKWKKKKLRLLPEQLIYFDDSSETPGKIRAMALIGCNVAPAYPNINVEPNSKDVAKIRKMLAFKVSVKKGDFIFSADTLQARNNWINVIINRHKKEHNKPSTPVPNIVNTEFAGNSEAEEGVTMGETEDQTVYPNYEEPEKEDSGSANASASPTPKRLSVQFAAAPVEIPDNDTNGKQEEVPADSLINDEIDQEVMAVMEKYNEQSMGSNAELRKNYAASYIFRSDREGRERERENR